MTAEPVEAPTAETPDLRAQAREAVATWPPLTGEQLTEIRRLFGLSSASPEKSASA